MDMLSKVAHNKGVIFCHGISDKGAQNGRQFNLYQRIDKVLISQKTSWQISAFTTRVGDSHLNYFNDISFIIKTGDIIHAKFEDAGTIANNGIINSGCKQLCTEDLIEKAIIDRFPGAWNEFIIENYEIHSIALHYDIPAHLAMILPDFEPFEKYMKKYNIPIYFLIGGQLYETKFDDIRMQYLKCGVVDLKTIYP